MPVSGASLHFDLYRDAVNPGANPSGNYTGPWRDKLTAADGTAWTGTFAAADGDASLDSLRFAGGTTLSKATGALTIDWENGTEARIRSELTWNAIKNIALDQFDGTKLTIQNFVDVLLALAANTIDQSVIIDGAKRGKIDLGSGNEAAVLDAAVRTWEALGCEGFARVDLMLGEGEVGPQVLEVNSIPGLTDTSLLPMAAEAAGLSFERFVERALELAL